MTEKSGISKYKYRFKGLALEIGIMNSAVVSIRFTDGDMASDESFKNDETACWVISELDEYFAGIRKKFNVPVNAVGTPFQKKVWDALLKIPYGETRNYKQIASDIGNEKAARAVGMACNRNPIAIIIPCHRVVGSDGTLTGYAGGIDVKRYLLELENAPDD